MDFGALFQPINIGSMRLKNRLYVPPMGTNLANHDGTCSDALVAYYTERAKGGFGMVNVECTGVSPNGIDLFNECGMWNDEQEESFKKLTESIHSFGAKTGMELVHHGREGSESSIGGKQVVAPSVVPCPMSQAIPRELSTQEIYEIIEQFVSSAERVRRAGFDAVILHAASGYLIEQFLSMHSNKRTDEFGGSLYNRMRFLMLIIKGIRGRLGNDYPIIVRLGAAEFMIGGPSLEEIKAVCRACEEAGADAIDVTVGTYGSIENVIASSYIEAGYQLKFAKEIKKCVNIPVIGVGRLSDPCVARQVILDGDIDIVAIGRQSMADPHFANKVLTGELDEICPCISCNHGCIQKLFTPPDHVSCVANPFNGFESEKKLLPTEKPKRVMVIGAGPAGLEVSWLLAKKGHKVELYERSNELGGAFLVASYPPGKTDLGKLIGYYIRQCRKYGVKITMNNEASRGTMAALRPDAIVLATGSKPLLPPIPGIDNPKNLGAHDVLRSRVTTGHKVLVAGGGLIGVETALFLAEQGREVTVIEMKSVIAEESPVHTRPALMHLLDEKKVQLLANSRIAEFRDDGVIYNAGGETKELLGFDSVVVALGAVAYNPLQADAEEVCNEVYVIGDAVQAGQVYKATHDAMDVALKI